MTQAGSARWSEAGQETSGTATTQSLIAKMVTIGSKPVWGSPPSAVSNFGNGLLLVFEFPVLIQNVTSG